MNSNPFKIFQCDNKGKGQCERPAEKCTFAHGSSDKHCKHSFDLKNPCEAPKCPLRHVYHDKQEECQCLQCHNRRKYDGKECYCPRCEGEEKEQSDYDSHEEKEDQKLLFKVKQCDFYRKGGCKNDKDECTYAHGLKDLHCPYSFNSVKQCTRSSCQLNHVYGKGYECECTQCHDRRIEDGEKCTCFRCKQPISDQSSIIAASEGSSFEEETKSGTTTSGKSAVEEETRSYIQWYLKKQAQEDLDEPEPQIDPEFKVQLIQELDKESQKLRDQKLKAQKEAQKEVLAKFGVMFAQEVSKFEVSKK